MSIKLDYKRIRYTNDYFVNMVMHVFECAPECPLRDLKRSKKTSEYIYVNMVRIAYVFRHK